MNSTEALRGLDTLAHREAKVLEHLSGVEYDSRKVKVGDVFVAMRGETTDGNRFVPDAIVRGARVIVTDSQEVLDTADRNNDIEIFLVKHGRRALATIAANLAGHPEKMLALSAITGTNGKTTTSYLLESLLRSGGRTCVLVGTIEYHVGNVVRPSLHTTPESKDILELFADGVKVSATEAVMEMSSHALEQERIWGLPVDIAIFTNLTQDHLDYHGTMEKYFAAKSRLFTGIGTDAPRVSIINVDDAYGERLTELSGSSQIWSYGLGTKSDFRAEQVRMGTGDTRFRMVTPEGSIEVRSPLTGRVNIYNLLAAGAAAMARGLTLDHVAAASAQVAQIPGRFQVVPSTNGVIVVVDYAHTDDALRCLIALARELVSEAGGRVITLFGCGGDRDRTKRPRMGRAAGEGSDLVILTSDNPRTEDPAAIIKDALAGIEETRTTCIVEEDRAGAIEIAIRAAMPGDIVLIAGKGHEKLQILGDETVSFDDVAVAARVLEELAR